MKKIWKIDRKVWDWIEDNLNSLNLFDLVLKDNDFENVYLCWKGTNDLFATVYVSVVKKIINKGY